MALPNPVYHAPYGTRTCSLDGVRVAPPKAGATDTRLPTKQREMFAAVARADGGMFHVRVVEALESAGLIYHRQGCPASRGIRRRCSRP
jgi:hypothetical protein